MSKDRTRQRPEAIGLPDAALAIWSDESTYSEASPAAGVPVPTAATQLALTATGAQTQEIDVRTQVGGVPTLDSGTARSGYVTHTGSRFIWRPDGTTPFYGYDAPLAVASTETIIGSTTTPEYVRDPDCAALDDGTVVVVAQVRDSAAVSGDEYRLESITRNPTTGGWTRVLIESTATAPTQDFQPCILTLPSGRLLVYRVLTNAVGGTTYRRLRGWYSDDGGTTWSHLGDGLVEQERSDPVDRMRAAYADGQISLWWTTNASAVRSADQFASTDLGNTFQHVNEYDNEGGAWDDASIGDVTAAPYGGFVVLLLGWEEPSELTAYVLTDALQVFDQGDGTQVAGTGDEDSEATALVTTKEGIIYAYHAISEIVSVYGSYDGGVTWWSTIPNHAVLRFPTAGDFVDKFCACMSRGVVVVPYLWQSGTASFTANLGVAYVGGWTGAPLSSTGSAFVETEQWGWEYCWRPWERPGNAGWTAAGAGTDTLATNGESLTITTTGTQTRTFTRTLADDSRVALQFAVEPDEASASANQSVSVSTSTLQISMRLGTATLELWDDLAGSTLGSVSGLGGGKVIEVRIEIDTTTRNVWTYLRERDVGLSPQDWSAGPAATASSGSPATSQIQWGHLSGHAGASVWYWMQWVDDSPARSNSAALTFPTSLRGRPMAGTPYAGAGAYIASRGGPTYRGEQWTVPTRATYRLEQATEIASPRIGWRAQDSTEQILALRWDDSGATRGPSDVLALALRDHNLNSITVAYYDGSSWTTIDTVTPGIDGLTYTRTGRGVRPGAPGTRVLMHHGEYADGYIILDGDAHRIASHSEGVWDSGYAVQPRLRISGDVSGTGTSGSATLIPRDCVLLIDLSGIDAQAIRLTIPSSAGAGGDAPPESYWQIGSLGLYWLHPMGSESAWGRVLTTEAQTETLMTRDKQRRVTRVAPQIRAAQVEWRAIHQVEVEQESGLPGWLGVTSTATPSATQQGTAFALDGMYRELGGDEETLAYLPGTPPIPPQGIAVMHRRHDFLIGHIASGAVQRTTEVGDHGVDELVSVGTIQIREDP